MQPKQQEVVVVVEVVAELLGLKILNKSPRKAQWTRMLAEAGLEAEAGVEAEVVVLLLLLLSKTTPMTPRAMGTMAFSTMEMRLR